MARRGLDPVEATANAFSLFCPSSRNLIIGDSSSRGRVVSATPSENSECSDGRRFAYVCGDILSWNVSYEKTTRQLQRAVLCFFRQHVRSAPVHQSPRHL